MYRARKIDRLYISRVRRIVWFDECDSLWSRWGETPMYSNLKEFSRGNSHCSVVRSEKFMHNLPKLHVRLLNFDDGENFSDVAA